MPRQEHPSSQPEIGVDRHRGRYLHAIGSDPGSKPLPAELPPLPERAEVLSTRLAVSDYGEVVDWMAATVARGGRAYMTAAAVNLVMTAREDPQTRAAVDGATLAVPDGQPLVWALRALGHSRATRVYGPDLMLAFCARAAREGIPVYLYGGRTVAALELLRARLTERFPGLQIVGSHSPPFRQLSDEELSEDCRAIDATGAAVVWVGTGQPKQEQWMARTRPLLAAPLLVGVGAAFDFHAGLVTQAPGWMQRAGLEWLFRLSREPRRLWRRYARYNPLFLACFARQYVDHRLLRRR